MNKNCFGSLRIAVSPLAFAASALCSHADLIAYEGFEYPVGSALSTKTGGYGWGTPWIVGGNVNNDRILAGNLLYDDGFGNVVKGLGNRVFVTADGITDGLASDPNAVPSANSSQSPRRLLEAYRGKVAGVTWVSFLALRTGQPDANVPGAVDAGGKILFNRATSLGLFYNATAGNTGQGSEVISLGRGTQTLEGASPLTNDTWGAVYKGNAVFTLATNDLWYTPANANSTADFILVRINHVNGVSNPRDDSMSLWVNPRLDDEGQLGTPAATFGPAAFSEKDRDLAFNVIRLFAGNYTTAAGSNNYGSIQVDEIKVGTGFSDVTTADPYPNDSDHDWLPDDWEITYGFSLSNDPAAHPDQLPSADPDNDGYTNLEESQFGTNPLVRGGVRGSLLLETWNDVSGSAIGSLTMSPRFASAPDMSEFVFSAETPVNRADGFGERMRGFVIAPATGSYTFYVAGDDSCELWLSPSDSQFAKQKIASVDGWASVQQWTKYPSQKSTAIPLVAGRKYYIEALLKESTGGDHLEIGWKIPGSSAIAIIPGSALESYTFDAQDPDGDNMASTWETAHGLNPAVNDAALDPDQDGIPNSLEYTNGSDPQVRNTIAGALLQELWWNVPGDRTASLDTEPRLLQPPDERTLAPSAQGTENRPEHYANILRGYLTAPVTGSYTFWAAGDDEVDFFLSTSSSKYDKELLVHPSVILRDFDADVSMRSRVVNLVAGQRYYLEMRHIDSHQGDYCEIAWQQPGGTREIIPGSVLSSYIPTADDADDDGLPDAWESANGLSPNDNGRLNPKNGVNGDLDGDGLNNAAEFKAGTRADLADTDGDGVNDRDEVEMMETQALMADAAPFESIAILPGASYTAASGSWIQDDGRARQDCVRGWLDYPVTLADAGVYQLDLAFTPVTGAEVSPDYEIVFSVDGHTIQRETVAVADATSGHAKILSPWLSAGSHTLRVFIDNSRYFRRVSVDQLEILAARGPDANTNGTPDWIDLRLAKYNSIEAPNVSITSPVCLEGRAKWSGFTTIAGATVQAAPNDRWYADVTLDANQPAEVTASLENGGLAVTRQIGWLTTNLLKVGTLNIRLGDSLKLSAFTGTTGTSEETVVITVEGQTTTITADQPLVRTFTTAGSVAVQVTHSLDGNLTTATATINVVAAPSLESPVGVVGYYREVTIPSLPAGVSLQLDNRIEIRSTTTYSAGSQLHILRLNTPDDRTGIFRLGGASGPVMAALPFRAIRIRDAGETAISYVEDLGNNTFHVMMPVLVDGLHPDVVLKYEIFIAGVTFDDGSLVKSLLIPGDFTPEGEHLLHFYKSGTSGASCHRLGVWQGPQRIAYRQ